MRTLIALAALSLLANSVQAMALDAKTLAQFDLGFTKCEKRFADMQGHRDEAYLALWKIKPDSKTLAELADLRKSAKYKSEHQLALKSTSAKPDDEKKLKQQCDATWGEALRNRQAPIPLPASAPSKPRH